MYKKETLMFTKIHTKEATILVKGHADKSISFIMKEPFRSYDINSKQFSIEKKIVYKGNWVFFLYHATGICDRHSHKPLMRNYGFCIISNECGK